MAHRRGRTSGCAAVCAAALLLALAAAPRCAAAAGNMTANGTAPSNSSAPAADTPLVLPARINTTTCLWDANKGLCGLSPGYLVSAFGPTGVPNRFAAAFLAEQAATLACAQFLNASTCATASSACAFDAAAAKCKPLASFYANTTSSMICPGSIASIYLPCSQASTSAACAEAGNCTWLGSNGCRHAAYASMGAAQVTAPSSSSAPPVLCPTPPPQFSEFQTKLTHYNPEIYGSCGALVAYTNYAQTCGGAAATQDSCTDQSLFCAWDAGGASGCNPSAVQLVRSVFGANVSSPAYEVASTCAGGVTAPACGGAARVVRVDGELVAAVVAGNFEMNGVEDDSSAGGGMMYESGASGSAYVSGGNKTTVKRPTGGAGGARAGGVAAAAAVGALLLTAGLLGA